MKKILLSCVLLVALPLQAQPNTGKVFEVLAKTYAKEQLKAQVAHFVNLNPHYVGSTNPQIGTEALRFASRIVAAYGLVTAKTDKERGWAALYLVYVPDPTTAMALFAIQLADTLVSLSHQKELLRIYEEVAALHAETSRILTAVYTEDFERQLEVIERITILMDLIHEDLERVTQSPLNEFSESISEEEALAVFEALFSLRQNIFDLQVAKIFWDQEVRAEELGLTEEMDKGLNQFVSNLGEVKASVDELYQKLVMVFQSAQAEESWGILQRRLAPHRRDLQLYLACTQASHRWARALAGSGQKVSFDQEVLVGECHSYFSKAEVSDEI